METKAERIYVSDREKAFIRSSFHNFSMSNIKGTNLYVYYIYIVYI